MKRSAFGAWSMAAALLAAVLGGCTVTSASRAPVEDRISQTGVLTTGAPRVDPSTLPGFENAGKPGYYTVRAGDTVRRIAAEVGQSWSDIAAWNNLENPDLIEIGQVLRVVPPTAASTAAATPAAAASEPVPIATQTTPGVATAAASAAPEAAAPAQPLAAGNIRFAWPASGSVIKKFDGDTNKGLNIGGKAGDPVLAAADGKVVYAASGPSGYGNLIIIKHDDTYMTAYAHNRALLVKEDQNVRKGQKIAEMGSSDADRVNLHFEIRRSGRPVDPVQYLPAR